MKTLKEYISESTRRGFLKGLASFAASAAVPAPVVKLLSTPAGVATMPIPAGIALLKGIQDHLSQWSAEDDSDYYEAYEDMADDLGFEEINPDDDDEDGPARVVDRDGEESAKLLFFWGGGVARSRSRSRSRVEIK